MNKTRRILLTLFIGLFLAGVGMVAVFETDTLPSGMMAGNQPSEFYWTTIMELLTLACAYLALRMFKFTKVHRDLFERKAEALLKWGTVRLLMLLLPFVVNTLLYYIYMNPAFGYMAIILALCLPFVFPSRGRCLSETES